MKTILKNLLGWVAMLFIAAGCSDDISDISVPTGSVEEENGALISVFNLCTDGELTGTHSVIFHVSAPKRDVYYSFSGTITPEKSIAVNGNEINLLCRLNLKNIKIPNGDYFISISGENLPNLGTHKVRLFDNTVTEVVRATFKYEGMKGEGTEENPYLVSSPNDFETLTSNLQKDPDHGYGIYFKQTESISLAHKTAGVVGVAPFQGTYDGGGHSIMSPEWKPYQQYPDSGVGLFSMLCNATVRNLTISGADFSGIAGRGGILAGSSKGNLILENLNIRGMIDGRGDYIGGVIGDVYGGVTVSNVVVEAGTRIYGKVNYSGGLFGSLQSTSNSSLKDIQCYADVDGAVYTGGMIGFMKGSAKLSAENITVDGSVAGKDYVGGVFGFIDNGEINTVTVGAAGNMIVNGAENVGGIAGYMTNTTLSDSQSFDFVKNSSGVLGVPAPQGFKSSYSGKVAGKRNVGGLAGYARNSGILHISSSATVDCIGEQTGGIVGFVDDTDNTSRIEDCTFSGQFISHFNDYIGGIVGFLRSSCGGRMQDCVNYASIVGGDYTGGICGYIHKEHNYDQGVKNMLEINWAVNAGKVDGANNVGGIIGRLYTHKEQTYLILDYEVAINHCMNAAYIIARGGDGEDGLGGIIGRSCLMTNVNYCANHGVIEAKGKLHSIGGIVGRLGQDAKYEKESNYGTRVIECINTGTIKSSHSSARVGGIAGYCEEGNDVNTTSSGIWNSRNSGTVVPDQNNDTGGILGWGDNLAVVQKNFNIGKVEHGNAILGTHKFNGVVRSGVNYFIEGTGASWPSWLAYGVPESKLTDQSAYPEFDFKSVWEMTSDGPNLRRNKWRDPASAAL
ncbi:MAG: hypothetical protein K2J82_07225 [Muribaculaceae bacterium]|nr:hypothetical protein [Muribaculaceae bacterium]MDE6754386.1 hypothetical protein [Muribaculaceae bacterium]